MSEAQSALGGQDWSEGLARVTETGPVGMITLRGDLAAKAVIDAATKATGTGMPATGRVEASASHAVCWMSPDELLLICPYDEVGAVMQAVQKKLGTAHALVVDVSDARAVFRISGDRAREVMGKLAPVDLSADAFGPGQFRRTRIAQVPAAFHMPDETTFELICFRSVAQYAFDLLKTAAAPGSEVGHY